MMQNNAASRQVSEEYHSQAVRSIKPAHNGIQASVMLMLVSATTMDSHPSARSPTTDATHSS